MSKSDYRVRQGNYAFYFDTLAAAESAHWQLGDKSHVSMWNGEKRKWVRVSASRRARAHLRRL